MHKVQKGFMQLLHQVGNLKLSQDRHGFWILSHINSKGQRAIRVTFPPHAKRQASVSFDNALLFVSQINRDPTHDQLAKVMSGRQIIRSEPSYTRADKHALPKRHHPRKKRSACQKLEHILTKVRKRREARREGGSLTGPQNCLPCPRK